MQASVPTLSLSLRPLRCFVAVLFLLTLASCGGGGDAQLGQDNPLLQSHPVASDAGPLTAFAALSAPLAAAPRVPDATSFLNWAEVTYPNLFPSAQPNQSVDIWTYRYYPQTNIYLGTNTSGDVLGLVGDGQGGYTSYPLGKIASFSCSVYPQDCAVTPPPATVSYNECVDPAAMTLPTGWNTRLTYNFEGVSAGQQTIESRVEGPATFEGQSAVLMRTVTGGSNSALGVSVATTTTNDSFLQIQPDGLLRELGTDSEVRNDGFSVGGVAIPASVITSKTVFNPPLDDRMFTLQVGESATLVSTGTVTTHENSGFTNNFSINESTVQTFVAREMVQVYGRNFDTCKYITHDTGSTDYVTTWFLVGKGVPVKVETPTPAGMQYMLLLSGTYNGAPI